MIRDSLNESFWNNRYLENNTGWDLGVISPPIKKWFDSHPRKENEFWIMLKKITDTIIKSP